MAVDALPVDVDLQFELDAGPADFLDAATGEMQLTQLEEFGQGSTAENALLDSQGQLDGTNTNSTAWHDDTPVDVVDDSTNVDGSAETSTDAELDAAQNESLDQAGTETIDPSIESPTIDAAGELDNSESATEINDSELNDADDSLDETVAETDSEPADDQTADMDLLVEDGHTVAFEVSASEPAATEIIFVDSQVDDYQTLIDGASDSTEIVILDGDRDGLDQIAEYLDGRDDIDAIHIVSHGSSGLLQLGSAEVTNENLDSYAEQLADIRDSLSDDADILFYGCNVAEGARGSEFVESIANATSADVAASTDRTGAADLGGNWNFETVIGVVTTGSAVSLAAQANFASVLVAPVVLDVTVDDMVITDADAGGTLTVVVTFDQTMLADGTADPTLIFNPDVEGGGTLTATGPGTWSTSGTFADDVFTQTFTITDVDVEVADVTIDVEDAVNVMGEAQVDYTPEIELDVDTLNPTVDVDIVDPSLNDGDNTSVVNFTFSEDTADFDNSDVTVVGGTLSAITGSGTSYTATFTATDGIDVVGSVTVDPGSYTDAGGNAGETGTDTVVIDTANPTVVVDIVDPTLNDGDNTSVVNFTFSEDTADFDNSDVTVVGGTLSAITGSGTSYSATFTATDGIDVVGSVTVDPASYTDPAGNLGETGTDTVAIDTANPTVIVDIVDPTLNDGDNTSVVNFTFSEATADFDNSDVTVVGGTLSAITGSGTNFTATFTATDGIDAAGSVTVDPGSYTDAGGNTGETGTDTVVIDTLNPTVVVEIVDASLNDMDNTSVVNFTFSEATTDFDNSDVTVIGGTLSAITGAGTSYTATFTATDGIDVVGSVTVDPGSYTDPVGNLGETGTDIVTIDTLNPTVVVDIVDASLSDSDNSSTVIFTFSEATTDFDNSDVTVVGGTLSAITGAGTSYTATFTATDGIDVVGSVTVDPGSYTDPVGNLGETGTDIVAIDTLNPTVVVDIVDVSLSDTDNTSVVNFTFSEVTTDFDNTDVTVVGGTLSAITGAGTSYTATFTATDGFDGTGSVTVDANSYTDPVGNLGETGADTVAIDTANPTVTSIVRADDDFTNAPTVDFTVTFSEDVTGVDATDFGLTTTVVGAAINSVTMVSADVYTVTVNTGTSDGTINLDLVPVPTINDLALNPLVDTTVVGADETYTIATTEVLLSAGELTVTDIRTATADNLTVSIVGTNLQIDSAGSPIAIGTDVIRIDADTVQIALADITGATGIEINSGDLDDIINIEGADRGLDIDGEGGNDTVNFQTTATSTLGGDVLVTAETSTITAALTTDGGDAKFDVVNDLAIDAIVETGAGNLFLAVSAGNVTQAAAITGTGLGLMVGGTTTLTNAANDFTTLAASNTGDIEYLDATDITIGSVTAAGMVVDDVVTTGDISITATSILDGDAVPDGADFDVDGADVTLVATTGSIGDTNTDVLKGTFEALEVRATGDLVANAPAGVVSLDATVTGTTSITALGAVIQSAADLDVSASTFSVTDLALLLAGNTLTVADAGLSVAGDLRIEAADVDAVTAGSPVTLGSGGTRLTGLVYNVATANDELVNVFTDRLDVTTFSDIELFINGGTSIEDLDCSLAGINTNGNTAVLNTNGAVTQGTDVDLVGPGSNDRILSDELLLLGSGPYTLTNATNDINTLAANVTEEIILQDVDELTVGTVSDVLTATPVVGITTTNDDVKLTTGGNLAIDDAVTLGAGDLFLAVTGNVTQAAAISGAGVGLMVSGTTTLQNAANNFVTIAADNGGETLYTDADTINVGTVTVDGMTVTGISTTNDDVKLTATAGNLTISEAVDVGTGDLFLTASGDVSQAAVISGEGLGLMVGGVTTLQNAANNFVTIAADNVGETLYTDVDALSVGAVTVDGMTVTGITTIDNDVKLTTGGDLSIDEAVAAGTGDLFLSVTGDLTQAAAISGGDLGLMVTGTTTLQNAANNFATIAADNGGETLYTDADAIDVGSVTVDGMTVTGITTTDDDVKLTTVAGNLTIREAVTLGAGDLFLAVTGDVSQTAAISGAGLGLMVTGTTTLQNAVNNFATIAADNGGETLYTDADAIDAGSVTVDGMTVTGITTTDDDVKLTTVAGNLTISEAIALGAGDLFLAVTGDVSQTAAISGAGLGLMVTGTTTLQNAANNFATIAADNDGETLYTDVDALDVGSVAVDGMTLTGISTIDDGVKLTTGGNLSVNETIAVGTGDLFLAVTGNLTQSAAISGAGLGLMVSGTTSLQSVTNNFTTVAADNGGETLYTDADAINVGSVTVDGMTVTGITTTDDAVKLTTVAGNLTIDETVALGAGDLFLNVTGDVSQTAAISGAGLGLMVSGTTTLQDVANNFVTIAADNGGETLYTDADAIDVGNVTVDGMTVTGITTTDDDVKLTTVAGNLTISDAIALGTGDLFLAVTGDVSQTAAISGAGLGLMVTGTTALQNTANNFTTIAANNDDQTLYTDADAIDVGTVTVDGMTVTGILTSDDNVKLTTVAGNLTISEVITLGDGDLFLAATGDVSQTAAISGTALGLMVTGTTTLQNVANNFTTIAANNGGETLYTDADTIDVGTVTVDGMTVTGITTTDDDVKLTTVAGNVTIGEAIALGAGDLFLAVTGNVSQTAAISGAGLGLMVSGTTILQNVANNFVTIAADNGGETLYTDADAIDVGSVTVDGMTVTGITTTDDDVKVATVAGNLTISDAVAVGAGDLFLAVTGDVSQTAAISGDGLGLMVTGTTTLQNVANNFVTVAADNGGQTLYTDADAVEVGSVSVDGMTATGITTSDDDVKLTTVAGDLTIADGIAIGAGDLFLAVTGDVTQAAAISGAGLGMMVTGTTTLQNVANNFATIAANNGDETLYTDANAIDVGTVTVDGMTVTGITTTDDNVKLTTVAGNLTISDAIALGDGDLFLAVTGNASQTAAISGTALGLMVTGTTTLQNVANNFVTIAADNDGETLYTDADGLDVGSVTVDGMTVTGIETSDDNVKLTNVAGNLTITETITVGLGDLFLAVNGDVSQTALISGTGLGLMVTGMTTLQNPANSFTTIAADNGGETLYSDATALDVGTVTVDGMTVTGVITSDDNVKLATTVGDLTISQAIALGTGDLFLSVADGNVTQTAAASGGGLGLMVTGTTTLENAANDFTTFAANNVGAVSYVDATSLIVDTVNVDVMTATGITSSGNDITIAVGEDLTVAQDINATDGNVATREVIELFADNDITLLNTGAATGVLITTDETAATLDVNALSDNLADHTALTDRVTIQADADGDATGIPTEGIVTIEDNVVISTDEGVANTFVLRPAPGVDGAFFNFDSIDASNLTDVGTGFTGVLSIEIGNFDEENLILRIDWGDSSPLNTFNTVAPTGGNEFLGPNFFNTTAYVLPNPAGDTVFQFEHFYSDVDVINSVIGRNSSSDPFQVRFAVQHHESILITGNAVTDGVVQQPVAPSVFAAETRGVITNTDIAEDPQLPFPRFDDGEAEFILPTLLPQNLLVVAEEGEAPIPEVIVPPEPPPVFIYPVFDDIGSEPTSSVAFEEDFFELRRTFEDGSVETLFKFPDQINTPDQLEAYIAEQSLTDGDGYEVWSISKQVKRRVVEFEITAGQLRSAVEQLPDNFDDLQLEKIDMQSEDADMSDDSAQLLPENGFESSFVTAEETLVPVADASPAIRVDVMSENSSFEQQAEINATTVEEATMTDDNSSASITALGFGIGFGHLARHRRTQRNRTNRFSHAERMRNRLKSRN